jgi:hypothetical protein
MYHLTTEGNKAAYIPVESKSDFATFFALAQENNHDTGFWTDAILEIKKTIDAEGDDLIATPARKRLRAANNDISYRVDCTADTDDSHLEDSDYEGPVRKSSRSTTMNEVAPRTRPAASRSLIASSPPPRSATVTSTAPYTTPTASSKGAVAKTEAADGDGQVPAADLVKVFVGKTCESFFECTRTSLAQSPVLSECITTREGGSHIMDPRFSEIDPTDFSAVVQFLNTQEYEPLLLQSDGSSSLDDSAGPINYPKDLERSAKLFNLAKRFQLPALADLIFRKVLHGHHRYDTQPFLTFASIVLSYQQPDFQPQDDIRGVLEDWIIKFLAENMKTFCSCGGRDARGFWAVMEIRSVELKVLRLRAELCEMFPGGRIKVED